MQRDDMHFTEYMIVHEVQIPFIRRGSKCVAGCDGIHWPHSSDLEHCYWRMSHVLHWARGPGEALLAFCHWYGKHWKPTYLSRSTFSAFQAMLSWITVMLARQVMCVAFSPDGEMLATASTDNCLNLVEAFAKCLLCLLGNSCAMFD